MVKLYLSFDPSWDPSRRSWVGVEVCDEMECVVVGGSNVQNLFDHCGGSTPA